MYWLYVLWNEKSRSRYVGRTTQLMPTLVDHDRGKFPLTKGESWTLEHVELVDRLDESVKRERLLKKGQGMEWLADPAGTRRVE
jgi:predicted GIY-YIG superfamily endonuclease